MLSYWDIFTVHRTNSGHIATNYVEGLLLCPKGHANMERIEEEVSESKYRSYQHFISNSKWDHEDLISMIALDASSVLKQHKETSGVPTGYIIDESSHLKKGVESVGVSNQYAGVAGKVDNQQFPI